MDKAMTEIDIEYLQQWVGKQERVDDEISLFPARALAAALDHEVLPELGDSLPPFWECLYFLATPRASETGPDGHPAKGGFLPPVPLPRRMWAAGSVEIMNALSIGEPAHRLSTIQSVELKQGKSGTLVFVNVQHDIDQGGVHCIRQIQNVVYREASEGPEPLPAGKRAKSPADYRQTYLPDPVLLYRFSALTYNGHRIHYDRKYAQDVEHYPALVVHGPLLVTLLLELQGQQLSQRPLRRFKFRAIRPTFDSSPFSLSLKHDGEALELWSEDHEGFICMTIAADFV